MKALISCLAWSVVVLAATSVPSAASDEHAYIGSSKCKKCHIRQYKSWSETTMALSFEVLRPGQRAEQKTAAGLDPDQDYTTDPECIRCHTTGYGEEGGFVDEATTADLVGIGCEMCHGAGGTYVADDYMSIKNKEYKREDIAAVGSIFPPTETQCQGCHNTDSPFVGDDYVFDFEQRKSEGTHDNTPLKYEH